MRFVIGALAAVVLVVSLWLFRSGRPTHELAPSLAPIARPSAPPIAPAPRPAPPPPSVAPAPSPPEEEAEGGAPARVQRALIEGHLALKSAARPCRSIDPHANGMQRLRFRYTLEINGALAQPSNVQVLDTSIENPEQLSCMQKAIAGARWSTASSDASYMTEEILWLSELDQ